ncbi:hypothetical protein HELRODRAFT_179788 [Helobdella robusta]|uniref:Uncharacterized protein n=1 Tax=Helobdella robusta TaxID=6412 RepID=T1FF58_HELRO|nr:hypothetical protein HELRODRAFT_179788 [Helobdella robusta]ESN95189.1 hypothetical protein HELRODRAFT_179788 [Helobdella robusta]
MTRAISYIHLNSSQTSVNKHGQGVHALHSPDQKFNINDWLIDLKRKRTWQEVYWLVWGCSNYLTCCKCKQGCKTRCHVVFETTSDTIENKVDNINSQDSIYSCADRNNKNNNNNNINISHTNSQVYQLLLAHKDLIVQQKNNSETQSLTPLDIFSIEGKPNITNNNNSTMTSSSKQPIKSTSSSSSTTTANTPTTTKCVNGSSKWIDVSNSIWDAFDGSNDSDISKSLDNDKWIYSDDEDDEDNDDDDDNECKRKDITAKIQMKAEKLKTKKHSCANLTSTKWDCSKSFRCNQDAQRQEGE